MRKKLVTALGIGLAALIGVIAYQRYGGGNLGNPRVGAVEATAFTRKGVPIPPGMMAEYDSSIKNSVKFF